MKHYITWVLLALMSTGCVDFSCTGPEDDTPKAEAKKEEVVEPIEVVLPGEPEEVVEHRPDQYFWALSNADIAAGEDIILSFLKPGDKVYINVQKFERQVAASDVYNVVATSTWMEEGVEQTGQCEVQMRDQLLDGEFQLSPIAETERPILLLGSLDQIADPNSIVNNDPYNMTYLAELTYEKSEKTVNPWYSFWAERAKPVKTGLIKIHEDYCEGFGGEEFQVDVETELVTPDTVYDTSILVHRVEEAGRTLPEQNPGHLFEKCVECWGYPGLDENNKYFDPNKPRIYKGGQK